MSSRAQQNRADWGSPQVRKSLREQPPGLCSQAHEEQECNHGHSASSFTGLSYLTNLTAFYNKMTGYADEETAVALAQFGFSQAFANHVPWHSHLEAEDVGLNRPLCRLKMG